MDATAHASSIGQAALSVGHTAFANHIPHVVSIRAGQGPADPQTPILPAKSHTIPAPTSRQLESQSNDAGYTPAGLVRSSSIPHNAFLHPNAALSMTHQAHLPSTNHSHHGHGSGATSQRNETLAAAMSNTHASSALPGGSAEAPARPPSTRPPGHSVGPNSAQGYSSTRQQAKPSPPQAAQVFNSKADVSHLYPNPAADGQSAHVAKLSVYHSPDPPVSAELYVPNKYSTPSHTQYQSMQQGQYSPPQDPEPAPGEDTPRAAPLPIPEPRRMYSSTPAPPPALAPDQSPVQPFDPRSPKQNVPAPGHILSASPWQGFRAQISPGQMKSATLPNNQTQTHDSPSAALDNIHPQASSRLAQLHSQSAAVNGSTSSHSPRNAQVNNIRGVQGNGTPKQSPSGRLNPRNGSNDTISLPTVAKQSPSGASYRPLNQHNAANAQSHAHAQSRLDTTTRGVTSMTSGYPDNARYRSQAPSSSYPLANPSSQAQSSTNVLSSIVNQTQANPSSSVYHQSHSYSRNPVQLTATATHPPPTDYSTRNHPAEPSITGYDYSQRSQATPTPATTANSSAAAIAAAYRSGTYQQEFGRATEPASAPPTQTHHRIPARSAPSPAPSARHYSNLLGTTTSRSAYPPAIAAPTPVRGQTHPIPDTGRGRSTSTPAPSTFHSRTVSDPQTGNIASRVAVAGHPSTPAPGKHHPPAINTSLSPAPEQDPLRTPSSLAPSMLHRGNSISSIHNAAPSAVPPKEKESRKRGGFLGLFRSRSSPPKQAEVRPPVMPKESKNRPRANSQTTINGIAASVKNIVTPHPNHTPAMTHTRPPTVRPEQQVPQSAPPTQTAYQSMHHPPSMYRTQPIHQPQPIAAPTPIAPDRNSSAKMFTPFRLLSKRHRTVSAASVEAQDGTAVSLTLFSLVS